MSEIGEKYTRRAARNTYLSSVISTGFVLCLLGVLGWFMINAKQLSDHVRQEVVIKVYVYKDQAPAEVNRLKKKLEAEKFTNHVRLITPDQAAEEFKAELGEDFVEFIGENPLPYTLELTLLPDFAHPDSIEGILTAPFFRENDPMIEEVRYNKTFLAALNERIDQVGLVMIGISALLLLVAVVLINNMIRLTIHARRFLIKTMQLVGATQGFIRRPFLAGSFVQGVYGALFAMLLISGAVYGITLVDPLFKELIDPVELAIVFGMVTLFGIFITWLATWLAVSRYLRLKSDDLY